MANIFEELMQSHAQLTESVSSKKTSKCDCKGKCKKFSAKKFRLESLRILEDAGLDGLDELDAEFAVDPEETNEDEVVLIIDPELPTDEEVPEDAAEQIVGDYVYKCPICGANYVCDPNSENEFLSVDEEGVPVECPVCGEDFDQILIGQIAPAEEVEGEDNQEMEPVEVEDEEEESEEVDDQGEEFEEEEYQEESIRRRGTSLVEKKDKKDQDNSKAVFKKVEKVIDKYYNTDWKNNENRGYSTYAGERFRLTDKTKKKDEWFSDLVMDAENKAFIIKGEVQKDALSDISKVLEKYGWTIKTATNESRRRRSRKESVEVEVKVDDNDDVKVETSFDDEIDDTFEIEEALRRIQEGKQELVAKDASELQDGDYVFRDSKGKKFLGTFEKSTKTKDKGLAKQGFLDLYFTNKEDPVDEIKGDQTFYVASGRYAKGGLKKKFWKDADDNTGKSKRDSDAEFEKEKRKQQEIDDENEKDHQRNRERNEKRLAASYHGRTSRKPITKNESLKSIAYNRSRALSEAKKTVSNRPYIFKEDKFESMMTKMIHENYKTKDSFKVTRATLSEGKLILNYLVGKRKGIFVAEGFDKKAPRMKLKIKDKGVFTESYAPTPSFVVECVCNQRVVTPVRVKYNFVKKINESYYRVRGEAK